MRSRLLGAALRGLALGLTVSGLTVACTIDPPAGTPPPPLSGALEGGPRETAFGRSGDEVVNNPQLRDKIRQMFGSDWGPGGKLVRGAEPFFGRTEPPRGVRVGDRNYVAVTGCVPDNCRAERVLLLIQEGGEALLARLDEGGFSHYYAYGGDWGLAGSTARVVDSGLRALGRSGDPYPRS
ncbi:MAG TPA: hypothetical protein VFZ82_02495 [Methylomirabilota bacterium]|nr:hypothetical protein [Methylomirabilota bacterium]